MVLFNISDIVSDLLSFIDNITQLITNFFKFFVEIVNYIPTPFREILIAFSLIMAVLIVIKIIGDLK